MNGFGDAPMKREGTMVVYDIKTEPIKDYEVDVSFDPRDGEFQGADEEWQE